MDPFLKWPGGKRWLVAKHKNIFPAQYNTYYEPFLGGGSVFFYLLPQHAVISDINKELINVYRIMARNPSQLRELLKRHQENHCHTYYYQVRSSIPKDSLSRAAQFLYLNRTCFNGMYRVNQNGQFNVPIGTKNHFIDDVNLFESYSQVLSSAHIRSQNFVRVIREAGEGDLVFADPPYAIACDQNTFIKYNEKLFSWKDQKRLLNALINARNRGANIIATNACYPQLQQMYMDHGFHTQILSRFSSISGTAKNRGLQSELLITSYQIQL